MREEEEEWERWWEEEETNRETRQTEVNLQKPPDSLHPVNIFRICLSVSHRTDVNSNNVALCILIE